MYLLTNSVGPIIYNGDMPEDFWASKWPGVGFDLNGTLDMYRGWQGYYRDYPLHPKALQMLLEFKQAGIFVVITTAQPNWRLLEVYDDLHRQLGDEFEDLIGMITNRKLPFLTICDRSLTFYGVYTDMVGRVQNFRAWWEGDDDADAPTPDQRKRLGLDKVRPGNGNSGRDRRTSRPRMSLAARVVWLVRQAFNRGVLFPLKSYRRRHK